MDVFSQELLKDFLDDIIWSYSNVKLFNTCKRAWYRNYILGEEGTPNFYAQYGTLSHSIFEKYAKGELDILDMPSFLEYNWDSIITAESPSNKFGEPLSVEYYNQLLDFIENFEGFDDETVGAEIEFFTDIITKNGVKKFKGFIDRLSIKDGEYVITDYKSKGKFYSKKELKDYAKQLYIYSKYVYETYGKFPKELKLVLFRTRKEEIIQFNEGDYRNAIKELVEGIDSIYDEMLFNCNYQYFFCNNLCEFRYDCIVE